MQFVSGSENLEHSVYTKSVDVNRCCRPTPPFAQKIKTVVDDDDDLFIAFHIFQRAHEKNEVVLFLASYTARFLSEVPPQEKLTYI